MPYDTEEIREVRCPKCGGHTWDNRATKRNPKAPDYKCKDRNCEGAVWPPKNGAAPDRVKPLTTAGEKQPYSSGPALPYESETGAPPQNVVTSVPARLDVLFNLYDACFAHAHSLAQRTLGNDASHEGIAAQAATLFIAASKP